MVVLHLHLFLKIVYGLLYLSELLHYPGNLMGLPYSFLHLPGIGYQPDHLSGLLYHPGNLVGLPSGFKHLSGLVYHHLQPLDSLCTSVQKMKIILLLLYYT